MIAEKNNGILHLLFRLRGIKGNYNFIFYGLNQVLSLSFMKNSFLLKQKPVAELIMLDERERYYVLVFLRARDFSFPSVLLCHT